MELCVDEADALAAHIATLERFIHLSTPVMEDGNNFGVSVQMTVAKELKEIREAVLKAAAEVLGYHAKRADAFEKLPGLVQETRTSGETTSESSGGKDGEEKKAGKSGSLERKANLRPDEDRLRAVVAVDVKAYVDARHVLTQLVNHVSVVLDSVEKNWEKLEKPKGSSGGRNYDNMY